MLGIDKEELKMVSTVVCCVFRRFIALKMEYEIDALPSN